MLSTKKVSIIQEKRKYTFDHEKIRIKKKETKQAFDLRSKIQEKKKETRSRQRYRPRKF